MKLNRKSRTDTARKPITIKNLAVAGFVLLVVFGFGAAIRDFRLWSLERRQAQAPKTIQPTDPPRITRAPKEPEIQDFQEPSPIEEEPAEPEPPAPEPAGPPTSTEVGDQRASAVQTEMMEAPFDQDLPSDDDDPAAKERRGREALALIGHGPAADEVWIEIINDPSVSANARSNLIEDLNEDGLQYRNLTQADLPVIQYRIELIEDLRPYAMDKVNADAFDEAHKDLVNMANRLTGNAPAR